MNETPKQLFAEKPKDEDSYLEYLFQNWKESDDSKTRHEITITDLEKSEDFYEFLGEKLGFDVSQYSEDAKKGLLIFLSQTKGFHNKSLDEIAAINPVFTKFVNSLPEEVREHKDFVSAHFIDEEKREALIKSFSLFVDNPDLLKSLILGRLYANYYGETVDVELGDEVIKLIARLSDANNEIVQTIEGLVDDPDTQAEVIASISRNLRTKAAKFVDDMFGRELYELIAEDPENYNGCAGVFVSSFRKIVADRELFLQSFKVLKQKDLLDLDKIKDTEFTSCKSWTFSPEEKARMVEILERNWSHESPEFLAEIRKSLEEQLAGHSSTFYVLKYKGEIVGFNRFDDNTRDDDNPHIYFGSFNTDPDYGNAKLGEAIYEESLKQQLERGFPVHADCDPFSPITSKYIESGFVVTELKLYGEKPSFHIVHDSERFVGTVGQSLSHDRIIKHAESGSYKSGDIIIREINSDDQFPELAAHRVLTRYFNSRETGKIYGVFEYERQPTQKAA